jgi:hydroxymethylpyrimidine/phosphomethylpyrimidine kinase
MNKPPLVLCIGGHDPSGGAGIQADIETVTALGGRAVTLLSAVTAQDTRNVRAIEPQPLRHFVRCLDTLLADITPDAVKLGLLGSRDIIDLLPPVLEALAVPLVVDPVLRAGGGYRFGDDDLAAALRDQLLPLATLATPNRAEARRLAELDDPVAAARALLAAGSRAVLLTGADEATGDAVSNLLLTGNDPPTAYHWPRLPGSYHGSGCTLASACAFGLAAGLPLPDAVQGAQAFTHDALVRAESPGHGQALPTRRA